MWDFTSNLPSHSFDHDRTSFDYNRLIAVDTIRVDEHSRLTFKSNLSNGKLFQSEKDIFIVGDRR